MKCTMNRRDISRFHKLLKADVKPDEISTMMQIEKSTLKKFTPDKMEASTERRKSQIQTQAKVKASAKEKATIVATAVVEALEEQSDAVSQPRQESNQEEESSSS